MSTFQPNPSAARVHNWTLTGLTVLFGLQHIRVLLPSLFYYLHESVGVGTLTIAALAFGLFGLSFLAGVLNHYLGVGRTLMLTAGGAAVLRMAEQLSNLPALDLALSALGVAAFILYIPVALARARAQGQQATTYFGSSLLLGLTADSMLLAGVRTLDLSWQPGFAPLVVVALLAAGSLAAMRRTIQAEPVEPLAEGGWAQSLPTAAIGPWLALQMLVFQNTARLAALTEWPLPGVGMLIGLGNALALAAAAWVARGGYRIYGAALLGSAALVALTALPPIYGVAAAVWQLIAIVAAAPLLMTILAGYGSGTSAPGVTRTAVANGIGQLLFVLLLSLYYLSYVFSLGFRSSAIPAAAAIIVAAAALGAAQGVSSAQARPADYRPAGAGLLFLALPLATWLAWRTPPPTAPAPDNRRLRVMTYNLHQGFNTAGRLDMEALAQMIEASRADVIALHEVSRGWVLNGSLDMLAWLSQRLQMPYYFGPTADPQWGNALLSRYPILRVSSRLLPPLSLGVRRGYIVAEINVGQATLKVIAAHLHHIPADSAVRQAQAPGLLAAWDRAPYTVVLGDMNAGPESPEMQLLAQVGLVDVSAAIGPRPHYTYPATNPDQQLDYIWATPDLAPSDFDIPLSTASDHLPVIATLTMQ